MKNIIQIGIVETTNAIKIYKSIEVVKFYCRFYGLQLLDNMYTTLRKKVKNSDWFIRNYSTEELDLVLNVHQWEDIAQGYNITKEGKTELDEIYENGYNMQPEQMDINWDGLSV